MARNLTSPSAGSTVVGVIKRHEGGTGVSTISEAGDLLDMTTMGEINSVNGVLGLGGENSKLDTFIPDGYLRTIGLKSNVVQQEVRSVVKNTMTEYTITNYDSFTDYTVTSTGGACVRYLDKIRYYAGNTLGSGSITLNGKTFDLTIKDICPVVSTITATTSAGSGNNASMVLTTSTFVMSGTTVGTHLNTDWQISLVSDFSSTYTTSMANATNKTTITFNGLPLNTMFYVRARHRSNLNYVSDWVYGQVTTKATYTPNIEQAKLASLDSVAGDYSTTSGVALDLYGKVCAFGTIYTDYSGFTNVGSVYIFRSAGNVWSLERRIDSPQLANDAHFGYSVALSWDGLRLAIGAKGYNGAAGGVYIFLYNTATGTWTQEALVIASDGVANDGLGYTVNLDNTGARLVVSAVEKTVSTFAYAGKVYVYLRTGVSWAQEAMITDASPGLSNYFGWKLALDTSGARLVTCAPYKNGTYSGQGTVFVYLRTGVAWALETSFTVALNAGAMFGYDLDIDVACSYIAVSARTYNNAANTNQGRLYVYGRATTTWTLRATIESPVVGVNQYFGHGVSMNSAGTIIIVSSPYVNTNSGNFHVYTGLNTTWAKISTVTASDIASGDYFGFSIRISKDGNRLAVGSRYDDGGKGSAYIYST